MKKLEEELSFIKSAIKAKFEADNVLLKRANEAK